MQSLGNLASLMRWKRPWFKLEQQNCSMLGWYTLTIIMLANKDTFNNWIKHHMCEDYHLVKK
jgi:hypothetical protein